MKKMKWLLPLVLLALGLMVAPCLAAEPELQVNLIDKDILKGMLGDPNLLIIDARHGHEWSKSTRKIKGALRFSPDGVASWGPLLPKDRKIVVYCS